jgi:hypothetical protein
LLLRVPLKINVKLQTLQNYSAHKFDEIKEMLNVNLLNKQLRLVQRGMDECQHSFEILIDAFVHAEQGTMQSQLIIAEKIRNLVKNQSNQNLPNGADYPLLPFSGLSKIITPNVLL